MVGPNFRRVAPFAFFLDYKYALPLVRDHKGASEKHQMHKTYLQAAKIGGAAHQHHLLHHCDEERSSSPPLDYGIV
jgi:hypothetical protein